MKPHGCNQKSKVQNFFDTDADIKNQPMNHNDGWMSAGGESCSANETASANRRLFNVLSSREDNLLNNTRPLYTDTVTFVYVDLFVNSITDVITIKRRPLLYIINLIFPVFCFLVLDVASFFTNASGTEKLGFKVTLLLSISVLLLILNDKLPSTASEMPLIGIYCIGVFSLIGISILETIFVSILIAKGKETKSVTPTESGVDVTVQHDGVKYLHYSLDTVTGRTEQMTCTPDMLKQILMEFWVFTQQHQEKVSPCWTLAARIVNGIFTVLYIIIVIGFLTFLGKVWFQF
nr:uncharacterized protein LOC129424709 [Misgurnus anguillicaudatus]